jgi:suppressor for copper-sensitivity B
MMSFARIGLMVGLSASFASWMDGRAYAAASAWVGDNRVAVRLITATDNPAAASTLDAGLEFRFAEGWHGYWRTPGDAGIAPTVDWTGSENILRNEIAWPAPSRLVIEDLQNAVYAKHVVLPVKLFLKDAGAPVRIKASLAYAACSDICVPYQAELVLPLPRGPGEAAPEAALIASARMSVPVTPAAAGFEVAATRVVGAASEPMLVVDLLAREKPFVRPDLFVEGAGNGLPAAPKVDLGADGKSARLTVRLPALPREGRPLILTLIDEGRAAEFPVNAK